jgi:hypothetical protein
VQGQEHRWGRSADVLWRLGPDRVLVRRVGDGGLDLLGVASMVWITLESPHTLDEVTRELRDVEPSIDEVSVDAALTELTRLGIVERR